MSGRRCVCGWCPIELPDDHIEWSAHHMTVHHSNGYSIRFYPALDVEQEFDELVRAVQS